jgi:hypothetical protein
MTRFALRVAATFALFAASSIAFAAAPIARMDPRAAPSEEQWPRVHAPDAMWLAGLPRLRTIRLQAPLDSERTKAVAAGIRGRVGFGRSPGARAAIAAPPGGRALLFSVVSPGAMHLRVAIRFSDSAQYRITSYRPGEESGAVSLYRKPAASSAPLDTVWTPVTGGDTQRVVVERLDGPASGWSIRVVRISHFDRSLDRAGASPESYGDSAPCQVDIACVYQVAPAAMQAGIVQANFAVALMVFTRSDGLTYVCTGTLLNSASYPSPIFLTAHHCLDDPQALATLTTIWFYNRLTCRIGVPNPGTVQVAGGATSLFDSAELDAALVLLNQMPPALATYTGWDAATMQPGTLILAIHHPKGDVKKASFGTELGIYPDPLTFSQLGTFAGGTFYIVSWDTGIIEPGSSGSGLLSFDAGTRLFYLRGTLTGGSDFTCSDVGKATTFYARFDNLYPHIEAILTQPLAPPAPTAVAVEYYYADWNFYFETAFPEEIAALDAGAFGGVWKRTGETFNVWPQPAGYAVATCRFFSTAFAPRSSHFYTPFADECAAVKNEPAWQYEGIAFYIQLADDAGQCPAGTVPLYRAYNNGMGGAPNHRYTTSIATLDQMLAAGWAFEGNGITKVFACVPQ